MYLDSDHSGLNKFSGLDDPNFKTVSSVIEKMVRETALPRLCGPSKDISANVFWLIPRIVNDLFTGRTGILNNIVNAISSSRRTQQQHRYIITGMGGQGKSEICLQIANKVRQEYVKLHFLWKLIEISLILAAFGAFFG